MSDLPETVVDDLGTIASSLSDIADALATMPLPSRRDLLAGMALQGLLANQAHLAVSHEAHVDFEEFVRSSVMYADAMVAALDTPKTPDPVEIAGAALVAAAEEYGAEFHDEELLGKLLQAVDAYVAARKR